MKFLRRVFALTLLLCYYAHAEEDDCTHSSVEYSTIPSPASYPTTSASSPPGPPTYPTGQSTPSTPTTLSTSIPRTLSTTRRQTTTSRRTTTTPTSRPPRTTTHRRTTSRTSHKSTHTGCYPLASPTVLPNLGPCQSGKQTFAIQARGCHDPYNGYYIGTKWSENARNEIFLVVNPAENGNITPTQFYLDSNRSMHAIPESTGNASQVLDTPIIFAWDKVDPGGYAGSLDFNTTAWYNYNSDPNNYYYAFDPVKWTIGINGRLRPRATYSHYTLIFGPTTFQGKNNGIGLWNGLGQDVGGGNTNLRNATLYAVPACIG